MDAPFQTLTTRFRFSNRPLSPLRWLAAALGLFVLSALGTACMSAYKKSVGGDTGQIVAKIYLIDFNTAWQSTLDALKHNALDISNREGGYIQTRWTDNTAEKNFVESFGNADAFLKAQYRFKINVAKGFHNGHASVKVSVLKEQLVQRDVLDGWRPIETDQLDESTLLYRVGRIIQMRAKLNRLEEEKTRKALENPGL